MTKTAAQAAVKLSHTSKMPCPSWGLAVGTCCVVECDYCYARKGRYRFPNVVLANHWRDQDWRKSNWVHRMVCALEHETYFRWFDTGDMYCEELAQKVVQVVRLTPWAKHTIPTKSHIMMALKPYVEMLESMPNCVVRRSTLNVDGEVDLDHNTLHITRLGYAHPTSKEQIVCPAYRKGNVCGNCRACWDARVKTVFLPLH